MKYLSKQKGFSLIELIVVIAIMAIVSGILIPVYTSMRPKIRLNGAARQLQGDLMWARMRAISENNDYVIAFGEDNKILTNNTYYIYDDDGTLNLDNLENETDKLVKTGVIPNEYKGVSYGFVPGNYNTGALVLGDKPVTFISGAANRPIWFRFKPTGRSNILGSIYLIQDEGPTTTDSRKNRMSKITVIKTGRIKLYSCHLVSGVWTWK